MANYSKSKIYKIINDVDDDIYIGATTKHYLCSRMNEHRQNLKLKNKNNLLYKKMELLGKEHFKIVLLESFNCNSKDELTKREQYYFDTLKPALNNNRANGKDVNRQKEYLKKYYQEHKAKPQEITN